ncbi:hypothetical protein V6N11_068018 [Hibiscus sabdariffa]|uniref:Clp R domain-containing protein n=1 Tax=Hibiscus sabdariffa TaxID=183260 RepID=A0ABR2STE9_9ROSI
MATHSLSSLPFALFTSHSLPSKRRLSLPLTSLYGNRLLLKPSTRFVVKHHSLVTTATVSLSLPTAKPDRASSEKSAKWSSRSIKSFAMAELEARKLKYPNTGTEALLMGILVEGTSQAAKFLRANGITLFKVREETVNLLGKSDMYFFSPEHPPLTEQAQRALDWAVDEKLKSGESGEITTAYLLLGIWSEKESAGHKILATLGFNDEKAKEVEKFLNEDIALNYKLKLPLKLLMALISSGAYVCKLNAPASVTEDHANKGELNNSDPIERFNPWMQATSRRAHKDLEAIQESLVQPDGVAASSEADKNLRTYYEEENANMTSTTNADAVVLELRSVLGKVVVALSEKVIPTQISLDPTAHVAVRVLESGTKKVQLSGQGRRSFVGITLGDWIGDLESDLTRTGKYIAATPTVNHDVQRESSGSSIQWRENMDFTKDMKK